VIENWNERLAETVRRLYQEAIADCSERGEAHREAALATGGVPVYSDLGGVLVIAPDGSIRLYDNAGVITPVVDLKWSHVARVLAAEKYPALRAVAPVRPENASTCRFCRGAGKVKEFLDAICGLCGGTGWLPPEAGSW
jgi:hypothetical protein